MYTYDYITSQEARKELASYFNGRIEKKRFEKLIEGKLPRHFYKYTGISKYSINNIINDELIVTRPTEFNDIYDSTMHFDNATEVENELEKLEEIYQEFGLPSLMTDEMKEAYLHQAKAKDQYSLDYLTKEFRIACLTTNSKSITMWSHYAYDNKGICIEYDVDIINSKLLPLLYPVTYIDHPFILSELCKDKERLNFAILLSIITKFKDWEYEDEWRLIVYLFNSNLDRVPLTGIPVKSIILGNRFIKHYKTLHNNDKEYVLYDQLFRHIIDKNILLKIVKPQVRSFQLEIEEINLTEVSNFGALKDRLGAYE